VRGGSQVAAVTLQAEFDRKNGALKLNSIPSKDTNKFGATLAASQSAQLFVGTDHALYVKVRASGAGTVFVIPAVGAISWWGRWDAAAP
jgi:hypothetical protein